MDRLRQKAKITAAFRHWDADGNGWIDREELQTVLIKVGVPKANVAKLVRDTFAKADTNGDGRVDYEEFVDWLFGDLEAKAAEKKQKSGVASKLLKVAEREWEAISKDKKADQETSPSNNGRPEFTRACTREARTVKNWAEATGDEINVDAEVAVARQKRENEEREKWQVIEAVPGSDVFVGVLREMVMIQPRLASDERRMSFARRLLRGVTLSMLASMEDLSDQYDTNEIKEWQLIEPPELRSCTAAFAAVPSKSPAAMKFGGLWGGRARSMHAVDGFVSHAWKGSPEVRSRQLFSLLDAFQGSPLGAHLASPSDAALWIDKFSSPQVGIAHEQVHRFGYLLHEYVALCPNIFVLLSAEYLDRLWCRYELVAFLTLHSYDHVHFGVEEFVRDDTEFWNRLEKSMLNGSMAQAECSIKTDRTLIFECLDENFVSLKAADTFLRFAMLALLGRTLLRWYAVESGGAENRWRLLLERLLEVALKVGCTDYTTEMAALRHEVPSHFTVSAEKRREWADSVLPMRFNETVGRLLVTEQVAAERPDAQLKGYARQLKMADA